LIHVSKSAWVHINISNEKRALRFNHWLPHFLLMRKLLITISPKYTSVAHPLGLLLPEAGEHHDSICRTDTHLHIAAGNSHETLTAAFQSKTQHLYA
jgi:hypothetical protein